MNAQINISETNTSVYDDAAYVALCEEKGRVSQKRTLSLKTSRRNENAASKSPKRLNERHHDTQKEQIMARRVKQRNLPAVEPEALADAVQLTRIMPWHGSNGDSGIFIYEMLEEIGIKPVPQLEGYEGDHDERLAYYKEREYSAKRKEEDYDDEKNNVIDFENAVNGGQRIKPCYVADSYEPDDLENGIHFIGGATNEMGRIGCISLK